MREVRGWKLVRQLADEMRSEVFEFRTSISSFTLPCLPAGRYLLISNYGFND
ncbi:MAG: hypothetical protein ACPLY7_00685 [Microgenomates group bacterium]